MFIDVNICENNEQGNRSGKAVRMDFSNPQGDTFLFLEHKQGLFPGGGAEIITNNRVIIIHGHRVKHNDCTEWAGNIFWNMYNLPIPYALGLINLVQQSKEWTVSEAWSEIYQKFQKLEPITATDLGVENMEEMKMLYEDPNQLKLIP